MTAQIALDEITRLAVEVRAAVDEIEYQAQLAREDLATEEPAPEPVAPPVPTGLTATVDPATNKVTLTWDPVPDVSYVIVESAYQGKRVQVGMEDTPTSVRGPLASPGRYVYHVASINASGEQSADSPGVEVVLGDVEQTPPPDEEEPPPPATGDDPVPAGAALVFDGLFDSTGFANYSNMQNGDHNGSPSSMDRALLVEDPERGTVCRFTVSPGDVPNFGGGERSEVRADGSADTRSGDELWYRFAVKFDEGFYEESSWFIVMQWHAGNGSPPMCVQVEGDNLVLANNRDWSQNRVIGKVIRGRWVEYVIHARFAGDGWAEVYQDGALVLARHNRTTLVSDHNYLKLGIYRDDDSDTDVVEHTGVQVYRS